MGSDGQETGEIVPGTTPAGKVEAVRRAKAALGEVSSADLAAYIGATFDVTIKPAIVSVLLATLRERELIEQSRRKAQEVIEAARAEEAAAAPKGRKRRKKAPESGDAA